MIYQTRLGIMDIYWHCTIIHSHDTKTRNKKKDCCATHDRRIHRNCQNEKSGKFGASNRKILIGIQWASVIWFNFELIWKCYRIVSSHPSIQFAEYSIRVYTPDHRFNRIIFELNINYKSVGDAVFRMCVSRSTLTTDTFCLFRWWMDECPALLSQLTSKQ